MLDKILDQIVRTVESLKTSNMEVVVRKVERFDDWSAIEVSIDSVPVRLVKVSLMGRKVSIFLVLLNEQTIRNEEMAIIENSLGGPCGQQERR